MRSFEMDDELSSEQQLLRETVARFLEREVTPSVGGCEQRGEFDWTLPARLKEFGYLGGFLPESEGGFGMSSLDYTVLMEEAGYCWHSLRAILNTHTNLQTQFGKAELSAPFILEGYSATRKNLADSRQRDPRFGISRKTLSRAMQST